MNWQGKLLPETNEVKKGFLLVDREYQDRSGEGRKGLKIEYQELMDEVRE